LAGLLTTETVCLVNACWCASYEDDPSPENMRRGRWGATENKNKKNTRVAESNLVKLGPPTKISGMQRRKTPLAMRASLVHKNAGARALCRRQTHAQHARMKRCAQTSDCWGAPAAACWAVVSWFMAYLLIDGDAVRNAQDAELGRHVEVKNVAPVMMSDLVDRTTLRGRRR